MVSEANATPMPWYELGAWVAGVIAVFAVMPSLRFKGGLRWLPPRCWAPGAFVWYQVAWLSGGVVLVAAFATPQSLVALPDPLPAWTSVLSPWVILGGALGGSTISVVGVSRHAHEWDGARYAFFHLARPLLGLITGCVSVLILIFVINGFSGGTNAAGASAVTLDPSKPFSAAGHAFMFVIAFVVGYREDSFRELVKRVADLMLTKSTENSDSAFTIGFLPSSITVTASRASGIGAAVVYFANTTATALGGEIVFSIEPDAGFKVAPVKVNGLSAKGALPLTVSWNPQGNGKPNTAVLTAKAGDRQFTVTLAGAMEG
jgi:hypothetical protein